MQCLELWLTGGVWRCLAIEVLWLYSVRRDMLLPISKCLAYLSKERPQQWPFMHIVFVRTSDRVVSTALDETGAKSANVGDR